MNDRINAGQEELQFPDDYTVIDIETTGLDFTSDRITEIAAVKIRCGKVTARYESLTASDVPICDRVSQLTGLSNDMLIDAPSFGELAAPLCHFLEGETIVGHHISFDLTFLTNALKEEGFPPLKNACIDTLPLSQKLFPEFAHHRLRDMASYFHMNTDHIHRAMADCIMNYQVFERLKQTILRQYGSYDPFIRVYGSLPKRIHAEDIKPAFSTFDSAHPLYHKNCVITGVLKRFPRKEAMQRIADAGGFNKDKLNTSCDFLILGSSSYCDLLAGLTTKHKKALRLIDEGYPITILTEDEFYHLLSL